MRDDIECLAQTLRRLARCSDDEQRPYVESLQARVQAGRLRVLFVGEAKRGKSTLLNALLGRELLPVGVTPVTAITTTVRAGTPERTDIRLDNGQHLSVPVEDLAAFVSERGNPHNRRGVAAVVVQVETPLPARGLELVDTPGVGSVLEHNTEQARESLATMDAAVVVLTADPPISASERLWLEQVSELAVRTFVVLNKADRLEPTERAEAEAFTRRVLDDVFGEEVPFFVCSARRALAARVAGDGGEWAASGLEALADGLASHLGEKIHAELNASIAAAARRTVDALLDGCAVAVATMDAVATENAGQLAAFSELLAMTRVRAVEAQAVVATTARRLRAELDADARLLVHEVIADVSLALERLSRRTDVASGVERERRGREIIGGVAQNRIDAWSRRWNHRLDDAVTALTARQQRIVDAEVAGVHAAARSLLHVELRATVPTVTGPDVPAPRYEFGPDIGWNEPLVSAVRRHAPKFLSRRWVDAYLRDVSVRLVDKNAGRARSSLQRYLEALSRELRASIARGFADQVDRLELSVQRASAMRTSSQDDQDAERSSLRWRHHELEEVLAELETL